MGQIRLEMLLGVLIVLDIIFAKDKKFKILVILIILTVLTLVCLIAYHSLPIN